MSPPIFIGLGSNLGNPIEHVQMAMHAIQALPGTTLVKSASLYRTAPVGPVEQDCFINTVIQISSTLAPLPLLDALLAIEASQGRVRTSHWGPRTLDCDLLYYGHRVMQSPRLVLPHPQILHRAFVLVPLAEIAPTWQHIDGQCILKASQRCCLDGIQRLRLHEEFFE